MDRNMSGARIFDGLDSNRAAGDIRLRNEALSTSVASSWHVKLLFLIFLLTLPLVNPWVRGDGVGYYAYVRSALIDHDLRFENDYLAANDSFVFAHIDAQ